MPYSQTFSHTTHLPPLPPGSLQRDALPSPSQQIGLPSSSGGRFATFPVKGKRQGTYSPAITPQDSSQSASTFTEDVEHALLRDPDEPAPIYEITEGVYAPPGKAPPVAPGESLYGGSDSKAYDGLSSYVPPSAGEGEEEVQLPYMDPPQSERRVRFGSRPIQMPRPWSHLDPETISAEKPGGPSPVSAEQAPFPDPAQTPLASGQGGNASPVSPKGSVSQDRLPTPPYHLAELEDEQALNAAAAREVSREMDALMYSPPPPPPPRTASPEAVVPAPLSIHPVVLPPPSRQSNDSLPHPPSPFARTRNRSPASPTASRSSAEQPPSPINGSPSPRVPSAPSSPTQQAFLPPPNISLPPSSSPSLSSAISTPFRTPPEFPANPSPKLSQRTLPQPPLGSPPAKMPSLPPPGSRTISAAAFRRPVPRLGSDTISGSPDVNPLSIKKRDMRSSPYIPPTGGSFGSTPSLPLAQAPVPAPPQPQAQPQEDEFDYISAYYGSVGEDSSAPTPISETRPRSSSLLR